MTQELFQEWVLLNISKHNLTDKQIIRLYELESHTPIRPLKFDSVIVDYYLPF